MRLIVDNEAISFAEGDSILLALLRDERHPRGGGCLCLGGDCPHCLATVDGIAYVRTCQVQARPGMVVETQPAGTYPALPDDMRHGAVVPAQNVHSDVIVIGQGYSGRAAAEMARSAGKSVMTFDVGAGQEVVGIYHGPLVVVRSEMGMIHAHAHEEVVVATGAAEIQPVVPGSELAGLVTASAAKRLADAGIDLGRLVAVGSVPTGVKVVPLDGELVRFEGNGRVEAVVTRSSNGRERRTACDTVSLGLGLHPRDALQRMGHDLAVRAVGKAARPSDIPACPAQGIVCPCSGVSVADLEFIWDQGFQEMELVKRATLAGTGTCQGSVCLPYLRSFLAQKGQVLQPAFTARPVTRQLTLGEIAAGAQHQATARSALDGEHRRLGAQMERSGGWWRPWHYGNEDEEYWAVRAGVSIMDVSTLGKIVVSGPDALPFLEKVYPTRVSTIKTGHSRYVVLLDERGYVLDDGMIAKESDTRYSLTFTSGGATLSEMWLRDWAGSGPFDVHLLNQTMSLGAINVTGPLAPRLLEDAGVEILPEFLKHGDVEIAGIPCKAYRLSFTGELSYEIHHPAHLSLALWRFLMTTGAGLGIKPHGLATLLRLRLEKGHIIVGQDTDMDSTVRRLHHEWMVKLDKPSFIGRQAVARTNEIELDKQLVGLEMSGAPPIEGAVMWSQGVYAGYVTSSTWSPVLGRSVMLGWLFFEDGQLPAEVLVDGRVARRVPTPFYDKEGRRARV